MNEIHKKSGVVWGGVGGGFCGKRIYVDLFLDSIYRYGSIRKTHLSSCRYIALKEGDGMYRDGGER